MAVALPYKSAYPCDLEHQELASYMPRLEQMCMLWASCQPPRTLKLRCYLPATRCQITRGAAHEAPQECHFGRQGS